MAISSRFKLYCAGRNVALQRSCRVPPLLSTGLSTSKCGLQNDLQLPALCSGSFLDASDQAGRTPISRISVVASRSLVRSDLPTFLLSSCRVTYPNMVRWFEEQGVEMELSDMSFAVSLDGGKGCEWGSTSLAGLFAQKRNLANPHFYRMLREMVLFQGDVLQYLAGLEAEDATLDQNETLGQFLEARGYSAKFRKCYLLPVCSAIWSCSSQGVLGCSAASILSFLRNHHMLQASSGRTRGHRSNQAPGKDHFAPLAGNDDPLSF
jgi:hypothetical protein